MTDPSPNRDALEAALAALEACGATIDALPEAQRPEAAHQRLTPLVAALGKALSDDGAGP